MKDRNTENIERVTAFIKKNLAERLTPFINEQATPRLREQIQTIVRGHLEYLAKEIPTTVPRVEAFMSSPGTVSFRFLDRLDPRMHLALYQAGLVDEPPEPAEYIELTMVVPAPAEHVVIDEVEVRSFDLVPEEKLVDPHTKLAPFDRDTFEAHEHDWDTDGETDVCLVCGWRVARKP